MVSTRKMKQQNRRLFSQLSESDIIFLIGRSNHGFQTESEVNVGDKGISLENTINPTQVNYPQIDLHTLEENIVRKVRSKVDCLMTTVETRVEEAVSTALESLVIP